MNIKNDVKKEKVQVAMHEMFIAQSIVELAEDVAIREHADSIRSIDIEIGALSGVDKDALEFALEMTVKNTRLEKAKIDFLEIVGEAECLCCGKLFGTSDLLALCPDCKQANYKIIAGKQLRVKSLVM